MTTNEGEHESTIEEEQFVKEYEILRDDYPNYDHSFKVIVIGNSGKKIYFLIYKYNKKELENHVYQSKLQNINLTKIICQQLVLNIFHSM